MVKLNISIMYHDIKLKKYRIELTMYFNCEEWGGWVWWRHGSVLSGSGC